MIKNILAVAVIGAAAMGAQAAPAVLVSNGSLDKHVRRRQLHVQRRAGIGRGLLLPQRAEHARHRERLGRQLRQHRQRQRPVETRPAARPTSTRPRKAAFRGCNPGPTAKSSNSPSRPGRGHVPADLDRRQSRRQLNYSVAFTGGTADYFGATQFSTTVQRRLEGGGTGAHDHGWRWATLSFTGDTSWGHATRPASSTTCQLASDVPEPAPAADAGWSAPWAWWPGVAARRSDPVAQLRRGRVAVSA